MKLACQSQSHKKSSYWAQLAGFIQPERKGRPDRSSLASHTTERRVNTQKLKKPSHSACHNLILADVLWNDDQILSRQGAWSNGREWTRQTGGVKIICKENGSPALLLFYLRANVQDTAGGGGMCVLSVQDNREAITAHILQDRNLRCHWNAPREKKETCHMVALLERCSQTHTHRRWDTRTKGVVLGFLRTTGVNGSPPTEVKEEPPPTTTSNTAIRARVLLRAPLNFQMPQIPTVSEHWELKSKKNPHLLHCLFLSRGEGAFILCINLGFKHTWPQWN